MAYFNLCLLYLPLNIVEKILMNANKKTCT